MQAIKELDVLRSGSLADRKGKGKEVRKVEQRRVGVAVIANYLVGLYIVCDGTSSDTLARNDASRCRVRGILSPGCTPRPDWLGRRRRLGSTSRNSPGYLLALPAIIGLDVLSVRVSLPHCQVQCDSSTPFINEVPTSWPRPIDSFHIFNHVDLIGPLNSLCQIERVDRSHGYRYASCFCSIYRL